MENWSSSSMITVAAKIVNRYVYGADVFIKQLTFSLLPIAKLSLYVFFCVASMGEAAVAELKHSVEIFESLDSTLKCPRRYISFVHTYFNLVNKKTLELAERHQRIQVESTVLFLANLSATYKLFYREA